MKRLFIAFSCILLWCSVAVADVAITLPYTQDFSSGTSVSEAAWLVNGATASRVAESWRGSGNYCAKLTPPTRDYNGGNTTDGGYSALGRYTFSASSVFNIAFAIKIGTTYDATSVAGSGTQNKFIDVGGGSPSRTGILTLNKRANPHFVWALWQIPTGTNYYSDGSTTTGIDNWGASSGQLTFDDGNGGALDFAGRWLWVNYIVTPTSEQIYVYDQAGTRSGLYFQITNTITNSASFYIGGYYNHTHPTANANTYIMLDDLQVTGTSTPQSPPSGFIGGTPPDLTPNQFTFTDVTGATRSTVYTSNAITVAGIDASTSVSITGGTYSKNGAAYTSSAGTAVLGDTFAVRVTSSASYSTAVNAVLTIGGVSDTYTVTTLADTVPAFVDNLSPSGVLACISNPRNVTLSLTTDEAATARMALTDIAYASMTDTFTTTGGTSHSEVKSLACGAAYTYYVRTRDSANNDNPTSSTISFSIASPQIAGPGGFRITGGRIGGN